jgi:hypothetical protein
MVWSIGREVFLMRAREVLNYESILQGARWCVTGHCLCDQLYRGKTSAITRGRSHTPVQ